MKSHKEETAVLQKWVRPMLFGAVAGALTCLAVLLLLAALLAARDVPQTAVTPMAVAAAAIGAFVGGFVAAKIAGEKGWLFGAACGLLLFLLILVAGGLSMLRDIRGSMLLTKLGVMLAAAAVGGMAGVNLGHSRRRR